MQLCLDNEFLVYFVFNGKILSSENNPSDILAENGELGQ